MWTLRNKCPLIYSKSLEITVLTSLVMTITYHQKLLNPPDADDGPDVGRGERAALSSLYESEVKGRVKMINKYYQERTQMYHRYYGVSF